ncbi:hypothetical protein AB5L52_42160 [Streptomyces sp. CG4]
MGLPILVPDPVAQPLRNPARSPLVEVFLGLLRDVAHERTATWDEQSGDG